VGGFGGAGSVFLAAAALLEEVMKICPFCGGGMLDSRFSDEGTWQVWCLECAALGPADPFDAVARELWDQREYDEGQWSAMRAWLLSQTTMGGEILAAEALNKMDELEHSGVG
jgi:hypothetical protein